ncbi:phosphoenolpyruvate synthase [Secundilactobacillus kimchicus]|uniref:phosphoenolpyruvate synthase n=1 Tax=Secundilactobacillus kimchicus TaxID=528209 RepID=UPI0024A7F124|nr:phosphoenolpyruvate synthase [Secundilactobacillus kimchicus]
MAYKKHVWCDNERITADKLNNIENGVDNQQVGPAGPTGVKGDKGDTGATGVGFKSLALTADIDGKITGGTATLTDGTTQAVTVTTKPAS